MSGKFLPFSGSRLFRSDLFLPDNFLYLIFTLICLILLGIFNLFLVCNLQKAQRE